jgi:hypothetical protein
VGHSHILARRERLIHNFAVFTGRPPVVFRRNFTCKSTDGYLWEYDIWQLLQIVNFKEACCRPTLNAVLVNFSKLPIFKFVQSVEFRGVTAEEPMEREPQGFERGQSLKSVACQFLNQSDAKFASLQFKIYINLDHQQLKCLSEQVKKSEVLIPSGSTSVLINKYY